MDDQGRLGRLKRHNASNRKWKGSKFGVSVEAGSGGSECALCLRAADLCASHLLPKALYRYIRAKSGTVNDPIQFDGHSAVSTSKQISGKLLCESCENFFSEYGEKPVLSVCSRGPGSFELHEIASGLPVVSSRRGRHGVSMEVLDASSLGRLLHQLTYFAVSVIWRWSVGYSAWPKQAEFPKRIGRFEDHLRGYLLRREALPSTVAVNVVVLRPTMPIELLSTPVGGKSGSPRTYDFWIPGLRFMVQLGGRLDEAFDRVALTSSTPLLWRVDPRDYAPHLDNMVWAVRHVPKGKLARAMASNGLEPQEPSVSASPEGRR